MIYRLSARAEADLAEIWVYCAEQWNLEQADRYVEALVSRFDWLCDNPPLWTPRPDTRLARPTPTRGCAGPSERILYALALRRCSGTGEYERSGRPEGDSARFAGYG